MPLLSSACRAFAERGEDLPLCNSVRLALFSSLVGALELAQLGVAALGRVV